MNLGNTIKTLRKRKGYRQNVFAERCGLSQTYFSQLENNHQEPNLSTLRVIAENLDTSIPILFFMALDEADIPPAKRPLFSVINPLIKSFMEELTEHESTNQS